LAGHGNLRKESRTPPGRLRVRFAPTSIIGEVDPPVAAATRTAAALLAELGHDVREETLPTAALEDFLPVWQRQVANAPALLPGRLQPVTRWLREEGRRYDLARCVGLRDDLRTRIREWFGDADLWLLPTVPVPPPEVGVASTLAPEAAFRWASRLGLNTAPFNVTGQPAASIPFGFGPEGLPIGVQLVGRAEGDAAVLAVSHQLETARPFRDACPEGFR
jgi:amidase